MKRKSHSTQHYVTEIRRGNRFALSQAITLAESQLETDRKQANEITAALLSDSGQSIRLGISGAPGVGKSTFINQLGLLLIEEHHRVAVLSIDPSSPQSRGSILGDKTRMNELSTHPKAYVRPSATGNHLGGVAQQTREAILLCEAAGYDIIIVETVGVGQSETLVHDMTDFFLLLLLSGAGDELQGIKRGIVEMADALAITKADGENQEAVRRAQHEYQQALHLFPENSRKLSPEVFSCSALENEGLDRIWTYITRFIRHSQETGYFSDQRQEQQLRWLHELIHQHLTRQFFQHPSVKSQLPQTEQSVLRGEVTVRQGAEQLIKVFYD